MAEVKRVAIFIDGSNLYHALKRDFGKASIDFSLLAKELVRDRELVRIYYYNSPRDQASDPEAYRAQQRFFDRLKRTPYLTLKLGRLEPRGSTFVEKGVDIYIATDMLRLAYNNAYDVAILVSGDGDFSIAVRAVQDLGKHVENAISRSAMSRDLRNTCDVFVEITQDMYDRCSL